MFLETNYNFYKKNANNNINTKNFIKKIILFFIYFLIFINIFYQKFDFLEKRKDLSKIETYYKLCNRGKFI